MIRQNLWDSYNGATIMKSIKPTINNTSLWSQGCRHDTTILTQLRSKYNFLNKSMSRYPKLNISPNFQKCIIPEDSEHFILYAIPNIY